MYNNSIDIYVNKHTSRSATKVEMSLSRGNTHA